MKIILICEAVFPENKGGLEKWIVWLAESLARSEFEVEYINASGVNEIRKNVKYISATTKKWHYINDGKRSIRQSINFSIAIRQIIRAANPDVVYAVQAPIISLFSLFIWFRRPWMLCVEWIEIWSLKYWRSYLGFYRGTIAYYLQSIAKRIGDVRLVFTQRCWNQLGNSNPKNILLPGLCMPQENAKLDSFSKRENLLFLGRFVGEKQPFLALEVARELRSMGWTGNFKLIGTGPLAQQLKSEISKNGMTTFVELIENASQEVIEKCFSNTFLLIHPSKREGYGLSMIESAERGIPTLLINYPENASIDINIPTNIVSTTENSKILARIALDVYENQETNFHLLKAWREDTLPLMSANESIERIVSLILEHTSNG